MSRGTAQAEQLRKPAFGLTRRWETTMTKLALVATLPPSCRLSRHSGSGSRCVGCAGRSSSANFAWPPGLLNKLQAKYPGFSRRRARSSPKGCASSFSPICRAASATSPCLHRQPTNSGMNSSSTRAPIRTSATRRSADFSSHARPRARAGATPVNEGLRRVWWWTCREEEHQSVRPTRLPLLFALDRKLNIPGGFYYTADCGSARRPTGSASGHCGGDSPIPPVDGSTSGMGIPAGPERRQRRRWFGRRFRWGCGGVAAAATEPSRNKRLPPALGPETEAQMERPIVETHEQAKQGTGACRCCSSSQPALRWSSSPSRSSPSFPALVTPTRIP